jgi:hypothetical protein
MNQVQAGPRTVKARKPWCRAGVKPHAVYGSAIIVHEFAAVVLSAVSVLMAVLSMLDLWLWHGASNGQIQDCKWLAGGATVSEFG